MGSNGADRTVRVLCDDASAISTSCAKKCEAKAGHASSALQTLSDLMTAGSFAISQHEIKSIVSGNSMQSLAGLHTHLPLVSTAGREEFDRPAVEVPRLSP